MQTGVNGRIPFSADSGRRKGERRARSHGVTPFIVPQQITHGQCDRSASGSARGTSVCVGEHCRVQPARLERSQGSWALQ